jgi:prevent-host-death family protein
MLITMCDAKRTLSDLLKRAARGEVIVTAKHGKPLAHLVPVKDRRPRHPGLAKRRVTGSFFEPLPDDELAAW